jgi:hypothetical protein
LVDGGKGIFSKLGELTFGNVLVVQSWQESGALNVGVIVLDVSEISSWSKPILSETGVNDLFSEEVGNVAHDSSETSWDCFDSHVWSTNGEDISDLTWHLTFLSDVSGQKTTLRQTNNVEFSLEIWMSSDFLA